MIDFSQAIHVDDLEDHLHEIFVVLVQAVGGIGICFKDVLCRLELTDFRSEILDQEQACIRG